MANATLYLKETDRRGEVLWEGPVCASCMAVHKQSFPTLPKGERRIERPWNGAETECMWCEDEVDYETVRADYEAWQRR